MISRLTVLTLVLLLHLSCQYQGKIQKCAVDAPTNEIAKGKAQLYGLLIDEQKYPVVGSSVRLIGQVTRKEYQVYSNLDGYYEISDIDPNERYLLKIEASGYWPFMKKNISLLAGNRSCISIKVYPKGTDMFVSA